MCNPIPRLGTRSQLKSRTVGLCNSRKTPRCYLKSVISGVQYIVGLRFSMRILHASVLIIIFCHFTGELVEEPFAVGIFRKDNLLLLDAAHQIANRTGSIG